MAAKDDHAARLTLIIGAYPKAFVPLITVLPGMAALILLPGIGRGWQPRVQPGDPRADGQVSAHRGSSAWR
jgi:SSS family solute:Na+ symporter